MKLTTLILLAVIGTCSVSCSSNQNKANGLPVLDVSKEYPIEKLDVREIAEIEYITFETTDESILAGGWVSMSDEYITINDLSGIFFFDRKTGKFLWKFNRRGESAEEYYSNAPVLIVDYPVKECYVYDLIRKTVYVYTYQGDFKRSFPLKRKKEFQTYPLYNYNKDFLIGYNSFSYRGKDKLMDSHPYYLISKKDGSISPLPLKVERPINGTIKSDEVTFIRFHEMINMVKSGDETFIGDFALDTLYVVKNDKLIPIAVQSPSVFSADAPLSIGVDLYTDKYLGFYVTKMKYVPEDPYRPLEEAPYLYWNRQTGEIHRYELYDSNILAEITLHPWVYMTQMDKNYAVSYLTAEFLIDQYKKDKLRGELKEIASKMDIEDNKLMILYKFK